MVRAREERKSQDMVVMGAEREGDVFFGMMGWRQVTPRW